MDFRVGGGFTQRMQIKGAGKFSFTATYDEIVEPERIVYHANLGSATTRVVVEFFDEGDQTKMVLTQEGPRTRTSAKIVSQGTMESFERLAKMLVCQPV
jgi:uncharacterized protein YndB with AHSA1/START domain